MDFKKLFKLSQALLKLAKVETDKAVLVADGEIAEGVEVFVEGPDGELVAPEDGDYVSEKEKITIKDGKVEAIEEIKEEKEQEPEQPKEEVKEEVKEEELSCKEKLEEEPAPEEPKQDEKDLKIAELEGLLKDRDAIVEELTAKVKELEAKLGEPADDSVKMSSMKNYRSTIKENPVLKYFQD